MKLIFNIATLLASSSKAFAELFSKITGDEQKRRGQYQVEWAKKLPWEVPGLDEAIPGIEVEMRSPSSSGTAAKGTAVELTLEDVDGESKTRGMLK